MANKTIAMDASGATRGDSGSTEFDYGNEFENELIFEPVEVDFSDLEQNHYRVDFGRTLGAGGEGIVVVAYDDAENEYAAKIFRLPSRREQNNQKVVFDFLRSQTKESSEGYRITHLMPLFAHGKLTLQELNEEERREYGILIMPKCECLGDSVQNHDFIKKEIIPSIAEALKVLHGQDIVHRDVKPDNIYKYNDVVVLGDYGISTVIDTERGLKETQTNRRTDGYWHSTGVVDCRGDWYSLGYTIWTMYNGNVHPHEELIKNGRLGEVLVGRRVVPFQPRCEADRSLGDLVYGLTAVIDNDRLGYEDIQKWIADPDSFEFIDPHEDLDGKWRRAYTFDNVRCTDGPQLAKALATNWNYALQHLYDGEDLVNHFSRNGDNDTSTKLRVIVRQEAGDNQDYGMAKAIYLISEEAQVMNWKGMDVSLPVLVETFASTSIDELSRYDSMLQSKFLSWSILQGNPDLEGAQETIELIEETSANNPRLARALFQHLFAGGGVAEFAGHESGDELVEFLLGSPREFYRAASEKKHVEDVLAGLAPFLANGGRLNSITALVEKFGTDPLVNAAELLLMFEGISDGNKATREFAARFGPAAPWLWVSQNIGLYQQKDGENAESARSAIKAASSISINESDSVQDITRKGAEAQFQAQAIESMLDDSPMPAYLGIQTASSVAPKTDDALFCSSFYGKSVPRGFVRELLQASDCTEAEWPEVSLLSTTARSSKEFAEPIIAKCDFLQAECEKVGASLGGRSTAMLRLVLDIALIACVFLLSPALFGIVSECTNAVLGIMGGTHELGYYVAKTTFACAIAFFAFDAVIAFVGVRSASVVGATRRHIEKTRSNIQDEVSSFASGSHPYATTLQDVASYASSSTMDISNELSRNQSTLDSIKAIGTSSLYMTIWHITAIVATFSFVSVCTVIAVGVAGKDLGLGLITIFSFIAVGVVYCIASLLWGRKGGRMYSNHGWLFMVFGQVISVIAVVILIYIVLAVIAVAISLIGLIIGGAILIGLLSS